MEIQRRCVKNQTIKAKQNVERLLHHKTIMSHRILPGIVLTVFLYSFATCAQGQGTLVYDQQSATSGTGPAGNPINQFQPVAQSFTPASSLIGFAQLQFDDAVLNNGIGSTVFLNLRENSITGNVVAATAPVSMPGNHFGTTSFFFSANIPVIAGNVYFLEPVLQAGDDTFVLAGIYNYAAGAAYFQGQPSANLDFWFREGYIVPEPSTGWLLLCGAGMMLNFRRRRKHSP